MSEHLGPWFVVGNCAQCGAPIFARHVAPAPLAQGDIAHGAAPPLPDVRWTCAHQETFQAKRELRK